MNVMLMLKGYHLQVVLFVNKKVIYQKIVIKLKMEYFIKEVVVIFVEVINIKNKIVQN